MDLLLESRNFSDTYLYGKSNYQRKLFEFIMSGIEIEKNDARFQDVLYDIKKRQVYNGMIEDLMDKRVILKISPNPLAKAYKVMYAKDPRDGIQKVFIDVTDIITDNSGAYTCKYPEVLISYLLTAHNMLIYYNDQKKISMNSVLVNSSTTAFADLFSYILEYLRVNGITEHKRQILYIAATYYQHNLLERDLNDTTKSVALKISGLTQREAQIVDIRLNEEDFSNIKTLIDCIGRILSARDLTVEVFIDKWCKLFGTGTYYASEMYTAFASLLTDAFVGAYVNNQKTIEKIVGRNMITFTTKLMEIG